MSLHNWTVSQSTRLDLFLREAIPLILKEDKSSEISNSKIRRLIVAGAVSVDKRQCRVPSAQVNVGSIVEADIDEQKFFFEKQPDDISFEVTAASVLYEDDAIIVVNKPAFFPTEETITGNRDNLHQAVIRYLWNKNPSLRNPPYAGIMHRLDRETSGVILFTKTRAVNKKVFEMFEQHTARKVYRAVCTKRSGFPEPEHSFSCDDAIGRVSASSAACKMGVVRSAKNGSFIKDAQTAHTDCIVVGKKDNQYFIDARPLTGRTHQIRVHLSSVGLPILGDELYGGSSWPRIMLHAQSLTFPHPVTGEVMCVEAPLPEEFVIHLHF